MNQPKAYYLTPTQVEILERLILADYDKQYPTIGMMEDINGLLSAIGCDEIEKNETNEYLWDDIPEYDL